MTDKKLNYRKVSKHIAGKLGLLEAYTYYCLAMKSDYKTGESNITWENLAHYYGSTDVDQIRRYIKNFMENKLVERKTNKHKG